MIVSKKFLVKNKRECFSIKVRKEIINTKEMRSYQIKTIKEIFDIINPKNVDGFLIDFGQWTKDMVRLKNLDLEAFRVIPETDVFKWNDDGNWGKIDKIEISIKENNKES